MNKKSGFTLAEVLVTLMIIGVIAAMTVPSLMQSTAQQEYKAALKKSLSMMNQAITMNYALDGVDLLAVVAHDEVAQDGLGHAAARTEDEARAGSDAEGHVEKMLVQ